MEARRGLDLRGRGLRRRLLPWSVPPGAAVRIRSVDRFLVSYPRSGNTWVRFMLTALLRDRPPTFHDAAACVPDIYATSAWRLWRTPDPRVLKSHEPHDPTYGRAVYLVRDPRDVAISYFFYSIRRGVIDADTDVGGWVERFVDGRLDDGYGRWDDHVLGWMEHAHVVRYEDIHQDPQRGLQQIADHLGIDASPDRVRRAVEAASAGRMRRLDRADVAAGRAEKGAREGYDFVRAAETGRGQRELPQASSRLIADRFAAAMRAADY